MTGFLGGSLGEVGDSAAVASVPMPEDAIECWLKLKWCSRCPREEATETLKSGLAGLGPVGVEYGGGPFLRDQSEGEMVLDAPDQSGLGLGLGPSLWLVARRLSGDGRATIEQKKYFQLEVHWSEWLPHDPGSWVQIQLAPKLFLREHSALLGPLALKPEKEMGSAICAAN